MPTPAEFWSTASTVANPQKSRSCQLPQGSPSDRCGALVEQFRELDARIEQARQRMDDVDASCVWFHAKELVASVRASERLLAIADRVVRARSHARAGGRTFEAAGRDAWALALALRIATARRAVRAYEAAALRARVFQEAASAAVAAATSE